jgi:hypothetical protein
LPLFHYISDDRAFGGHALNLTLDFGILEIQEIREESAITLDEARQKRPKERSFFSNVPLWASLSFIDTKCSTTKLNEAQRCSVNPQVNVIKPHENGMGRMVTHSRY